MKKLLIITLLISICLFAMISCSSNTDKTVAENDTITDSVPVSDEIKQTESVPETVDEISDVIENQETSGEFLQYEYDCAEMLLEHPVDELYELIGQPNDSSYASSCIGNGEDGELYYNGFTVVTYRENDIETVVDLYKD